jgi:thiosulfate/3-mercaptopyruvate sulfurtransferase
MTSGPLLISPLVSTQWLADHLGADKLVVLDATVLPTKLPTGRPGYLSGHEQYLVHGHVPGALFADVIEDFSAPGGAHPFTRPDAAQFEAAVASLGIDNETTVVVYDSVLGQWASRLWWLFRAFGYDSVAVLDGGFTKWNSEGRIIDVGHVEPALARFVAVERPESWADKAEVERIVNGEVDAALVCAIPAKEFSGEEGWRSRKGHIPGSVNVPAGRIVDLESRAFLSEQQLRAALAPALDHRRVVIYCAGGIAATADALALTLLGEKNIAIYDGSLNEWVTDENAPLVTAA